ncbi:hypothetical protein BDK51DRAFT_52950 [Blyttiomyces helicus]|uniref:Cyclin N-terminal domain-containing protein n=1 Tax=Blyttiomyces helicus TaxID=388810 RepID=A0A4P9WGB3_9FUNG|nr:hypothetical protein BDK51DRAFT_52950 [Blyttiomyces helicus]|eukprot:RKO91851.1 hypothetical protein BDK51DRAFT_52950 [Blyttiomyces helicus]
MTSRDLRRIVLPEESPSTVQFLNMQSSQLTHPLTSSPTTTSTALSYLQQYFVFYERPASLRGEELARFEEHEKTRLDDYVRGGGVGWKLCLSAGRRDLTQLVALWRARGGKLMEVEKPIPSAILLAPLIAATSIHLACKHSETPRKLRDIVNVAFWLCNQDDESQGFLPINENYWSLKDSIIAAELGLLRVLRFEFNVDLPHPHLFKTIRNFRDHHCEAFVTFSPLSDIRLSSDDNVTSVSPIPSPAYSTPIFSPFYDSISSPTRRNLRD